MIKKEKFCLASSVFAISSMGIGIASADTYYFDDFEEQPLGNPLNTPPIGLDYRYAATTQIEAVNVVEAPFPVIGTKSLEAVRDETRQAHVISVSNDGALINGNTLEVKWSHYLSSEPVGHPFNGPMQNSFGYSNGSIGALWFILINDAGSSPAAATYRYSDAFLSAPVATSVQPTIDGWDTLRVVMTLEEYDAQFMTGSYDLFVSLDGAPEVQLADDAVLYFAQKATEADASDGLTSAWFRIQKGPFTGHSYYDNIVIRDFTTAPEPAAWNVDSDGDWSLGTNWLPATAPNGVNATATFGSVITQSRTVTVDAPQTVGIVNFDNANSSYTIAGSSALTLDASGPAGINVLSGSHTISAPVVLAANLIVTSSASSGVAFTGEVSATGRTITKAGTGTAQFENVRSAALNVNEGVARIRSRATANDPSGTSVVLSLSIASGASLDLGNNSLVNDYTGSVGALVEEVRGHLQSGRLTSSSATAATRLGYGDNAVLNLTSFGGQTVDSSSLLVKYTYAGDADLNGQVDVADLGRLASAWQTSGPWTSGDFDYSGFIDVADLGLLASNWQAGVGSPLGPSFAEALAGLGLGGVAVPEPGAAMGMIGASILGLLPRRRRA